MEGDFAVNGTHQLCWVVSFLKIHDGYEDEWWKYPENRL
jgi:hypothetical protein